MGIIMFQLSWLRNMVLLRQEQIKEKVDAAVEIVGTELARYKGTFTPPNRSSSLPNMFNDDYTLDFLRPQTIGRRFTVEQLHDKIRTAFDQVGLEKMKFEFALAIVDLRNSLLGTIERESPNYERAYDDTIHNHSRGYTLISPSGSEAENIAIKLRIKIDPNAMIGPETAVTNVFSLQESPPRVEYALADA